MMDPLITNGMDGALLRVLEKRGDERDPVPRRRRPAVPEKPVEEEEQEENNNQDEADLDAPKHTLDDLA
jgi:hypothetical protein